MFQFQWYKDFADAKDAVAIRLKVFVDEQRFTKELELDETDHRALHLAVYDDDLPVGAARLYQDEKEERLYHAGRICILPAYRSRGLGAIILRQLEDKAQELGAIRITLSAQERASGFYEKSGYTQCGEVFYDEYCPHVEMFKDL